MESIVSCEMQLMQQLRVGTTLVQIFQLFGLIYLQNIHSVEGGSGLTNSSVRPCRQRRGKFIKINAAQSHTPPGEHPHAPPLKVERTEDPAEHVLAKNAAFHVFVNFLCTSKKPSNLKRLSPILYIQSCKTLNRHTVAFHLHHAHLDRWDELSNRCKV